MTALLLGITLMMNAALKIDRIDPTDWYVGMKDASLQLMVYGKDIRKAEVSTDYPGVRIDSIVRPDSPNYLLVYLDLSGARPGTMTLRFANGKQKQKVLYTLKARAMRGEDRQGFTNADVLYMLMPDRFASGRTDNDQVKGMRPYKNDRTQPSLRHGGDLEGIRQHLDYFLLGDGRDTLALKQALALLLTIRRTPQLYYGTEILMGGTKRVTDGHVRRDFPGGFPGDERNAFTAEGRTRAENDMYSWLRTLLHYRQGNALITEGTQTQFIPYKGVYVVARRHAGRTLLTILNGTSRPATLSVARYAEVIGRHAEGTDILTGRKIDFSHDVPLTPRQTLVVEL